MTRQALTTVEADFHERMHAAQIHGLWELASQMTRHAEPGVARSRQRDRQAGGLDGWPRRAARAGAERDVLSDVRRAAGAAQQAQERLGPSPRSRQPEPDVGQGAPAVFSTAALFLGD